MNKQKSYKLPGRDQHPKEDQNFFKNNLKLIVKSSGLSDLCLQAEILFQLASFGKALGEAR